MVSHFFKTGVVVSIVECHPLLRDKMLALRVTHGHLLVERYASSLVQFDRVQNYFLQRRGFVLAIHFDFANVVGIIELGGLFVATLLRMLVLFVIFFPSFVGLLHFLLLGFFWFFISRLSLFFNLDRLIGLILFCGNIVVFGLLLNLHWLFNFDVLLLDHK